LGSHSGLYQRSNTIYEFHGDYWHGNPDKYAADFVNEVSGKYMGELYQKTIERESRIKEMGYNLVIMWESDWNNN
jgi:G:T-mismatch repair DNA endonuclease (very short patch repair protein)